jgi:hypothetical protein
MVIGIKPELHQSKHCNNEIIVIKTQDFPEGTTEVVLELPFDKNQQLAGSLVNQY